jgi:hypothetical protein
VAEAGGTNANALERGGVTAFQGVFVDGRTPYMKTRFTATGVP